MTLNWDETADDFETSTAMLCLLTGNIWHDGKRWWAKDGTGTWVHTTVVGPFCHHLFEAARHLPPDPRWDRARHRLRSINGIYAVARIMKTEIQMKSIPKPADLAS